MRSKEVKCISAITKKGIVETAVLDTKIVQARKQINGNLKDISKYISEVAASANATRSN